jgi:hypothetical protein
MVWWEAPESRWLVLLTSQKFNAWKLLVLRPKGRPAGLGVARQDQRAKHRMVTKGGRYGDRNVQRGSFLHCRLL